MKIKEQIKKFSSKVWDKIEDHLATVVAGGIILICSTLCIIFWEWLKTEHLLKMYGGLWVLMFLVISGLPMLLLSVIKKKPTEVYTDENDIKNILGSRFRQVSVTHRGMSKTRLTVGFSDFDKSSNVKSGSSKKHLETIANNLGYHTVCKGNETIVFEKNGIVFKQGFLDNLY
jgi:hypothetical protein